MQNIKPSSSACTKIVKWLTDRSKLCKKIEVGVSDMTQSCDHLLQDMKQVQPGIAE